MRGGVRVHVALVEPRVALGLLRVGVLARDLRLMLDAAGDGGNEQEEEDSGRPAEAAVALRFGGVLDRDGQSRPASGSLRRGSLRRGGGHYCFVVELAAQYWTSSASSGSRPSPMSTPTRMPAFSSAAARLSFPRLNAVNGVISKVMSLPSVVLTTTLF